MTHVLHLDDGRSVSLGTEAELLAASQDISHATGGSSAAGQFSFLFGIHPHDSDRVMPADWGERLGKEAKEFNDLLGADLAEATRALLDRLASLADSP